MAYPSTRERLRTAFKDPRIDEAPVREHQVDAAPTTTRDRIAARAQAAEPTAPASPPSVAKAPPEPRELLVEAELEQQTGAALAVAADAARQLVAARAAPTLTVLPGGGAAATTAPASDGGSARHLRVVPSEDAPATDAPAPAVEAMARGPPVRDLVRAAVVQTKLAVSNPGDALEREADAVASRVVRGAAPARPSPCGRPAGRVRRASPVARAPPPRPLPHSAARVVDGPTGGTPLLPALRARIEPHVGLDLGHVRVRQGGDAAEAARDLRARAFTSGSTIFLAAGSSPADVALMAHEAAHVAQQQTAATARTTLMRDATDYLPDISVTDVIPDWILDGVRSAIRAIPGYTLLTYIVGRDPLTDEQVTAGAQELIETLLTYGPFGAAVGPVLQTIEVLGEIFAFVSESFAQHGLTLTRISRDIDAAWEELSVTNGIAGNVAIVQRYVDAFLRDVRGFVLSIVDRVLELVRSVVAEVAEPLLQTPEIAPYWNLAKKVMHYDPLRGTDVEAPTVEILEDFLRLTGQEQRLAQMQERGTLQEAADWLDTQFATFASLVGELGTLFSDAWEAIQPENLPDLLTNLRDLAQRAFGFVVRVGDFVFTILAKILELIKNALLAWLSEHAHTFPGFHLLTVILEQNPFTGETVPRTAENLIKGFITLMPGGEETYDQLAESGVIGDAASRIEGEMERLGISLEMITGLFRGIWDTLSLDDLLDPIGAFQRILALFGEPLGRLIEFIGVVIEVVITLVLRLMNFPSDLLGSIIANTLQAIEDIKRDPVAFIKNMLAAVKQGFTAFFDNILTYLIQGLQAWLFRGLGQLGITIPSDFTLASILELVLQVLGITAESLWTKLGEHIGPERVAMIRGALDRLAGAWQFIKDVQEGGIGAVWRYVTDQLSGLWDTLLDMAKNWIMTQIVQRVTARLLSMLDPTGIMAVVNSFIAFFAAVQSAIEYLRDILEIINRYVSTLAAVAAGNIEPGARMLEAGLAAAIPVAIGFLANQVGLGNIPEKVVEIIGRLRELVDQALDWLIGQAVRLGQAALRALGIGGEEAPAEEAEPGELVIREPFSSEGQDHQLYTAPGATDLMVASNGPTPLTNIVDPSGTIVTLNTEYLAARTRYDAALAALRTNPSARTGWTARRDEVNEVVGRIVAHVRALALDSAPGASAPGLGDVRRHGQQQIRIQDGPRVWYLESEHVMPFAIGKMLWDTVGEAIPGRGGSIDDLQTTIMIYERAADSKTNSHDVGAIGSFRSQYIARLQPAAARLRMFTEAEDIRPGGRSAARSDFAAVFADVIVGLRNASTAGVGATVTAVAAEHAMTDATGMSNGAKRAESAPLPTSAQIGSAATQQYDDVIELARTTVERATRT